MERSLAACLQPENPKVDESRQRIVEEWACLIDNAVKQWRRDGRVDISVLIWLHISNKCYNVSIYDYS